MVITDEMDAALLRQRGSDENSWQKKDRAKRIPVWLNHEHMRTQAVLQGLVLTWSDFEINFSYILFMLLLTIILAWQMGLYTMIGSSGTQLLKFTGPCEALVGNTVSQVATGCRSSVLPLRVTAPRPPPNHAGIAHYCKYFIITVTYSYNAVLKSN